MKDYLDELLDKVSAIIECGAGKPVEIARFVIGGENVESASVQASRWIKRQVKPAGPAALALNAWAAVKTLEIEAGGEETREAYRKAFAKTASGKAAVRRKAKA